MIETCTYEYVVDGRMVRKGGRWAVTFWAAVKLKFKAAWAINFKQNTSCNPSHLQRHDDRG